MKEVKKEIKKVNFIVDTLNTEVSVKDRIKEAKTFIMGLENSTQVGVALKYLAKFVETFIGSDGDKEVKAKLAEDTQKFIKDNPNFTVAKYQSVHTFYDYSVCMHPEYDALKEIADKVKARMSEIEKNELQPLAKAVESNNNKMFSDGDFSLDVPTKNIIVEYYHTFKTEVGGEEIVTINPPKKVTTMGLKYYIK